MDGPDAERAFGPDLAQTIFLMIPDAGSARNEGLLPARPLEDAAPRSIRATRE